MRTPWSRGHGEPQGTHARTAAGPAPAPSPPDPVPLGHRFDLVWRGYSRRQVNEYLDMELRWLTADRDAAISMVCKLTGLLNESRAEVLRLRERFDRQCREPLSADAVSERMRRLVEIARAEASEIVTRARARAEHIRTESAEATQRHEARAERRRRRIEEEFQLAMAEREACCRAEADRLLRDTWQRAERQVASAAAQVETLRGMRRHLVHRLNLVRGLLLRTCALLDPMDPDSEPVMLDPERRPG